MKQRTSWMWGWTALLLALTTTAWADLELVRPERRDDLERLRPEGARLELSRSGQTTALRMSGVGSGVARITITPAGGVWDLSAHEAIVLKLHNVGPRRLLVEARVENPTAEFRQDACQSLIGLDAGQPGELRVRLVRRPEDPGYEYFKPFFMYTRGIAVREGTVDPAQIARLVISFEAASGDDAIEIHSIRANGQGVPAPVPFFPFVDQFGQYKHADWPSKIYGPEQFEYWKKLEAEELQRAANPADWNEFGGYEAGPQLPASGFFYPTKYQAKWWLVDPKGRLFWSYGPTGVGFEAASPITDREHWFEWLPPPGGEFDFCFGRGSNARFMYYRDKQYVTFDFSKANLYRKYGPDWASIVRELQHRRLRSWGFNTIANWSDTQTMLMRRTPYVVAIHFHRMNFGHHHDVFDGEFQSDLRRRMEREIGTTANDPWNIGYFVDNELDWGIDPNFRALGWRAAQAPPDQPAKIEFVNDLKKKYGTIEALNRAWQKQFATWDALLANREPISSADVPVIRQDYEAFGIKFAETYFRICREEVKRVAPRNLYLGVRFHGHKDPTQLELAAKYCDVISYNIYDRTPASRANQYLGKVDHPILIGEWGFGSDYVQTPFRGRPEEDKTWTPQQRVDHLRNYMAAAVRHPLIVGAHFFQMRDQALTGRGDGEAVLRGFLNVADTPNYLLVEANRKVAAELYQSRVQSP